MTKIDPWPNQIQIRPYHASDLPGVKALHDRMQPFRPEDQAEVESMYARAAEAERTRDRWVPMSSAADSLDAIEQSYLAFWVAASAGEQANAQVVGMVGVRRAGVDLTEMGGPTKVAEWVQSGKVAELRRLRVAPELWRGGLGTRLCQTVIDWSRANGFRSLILNTTTPQRPAIALYRKLGFQELGRSFIGKYELVWLDLPL